MSAENTADSLVRVRSPNVDRYKRNFLKQVVCELRFPTLLELGDPKPPAQLINALRKEYPHLEAANEVTLGFAGSKNGSNYVHTMRSSKLTWAVSIKQSSLTIETTAYTDYAEMKKRILRIIEVAQKVIDTDFFTRVGLRYINVIDVKVDPSDGWVNPILVEPIRTQAFVNIHEFAGKLSLTAMDGGCLLQHGVRVKTGSESEKAMPEYFIDIDTYRNDVPLDKIGDALHVMHEQAFDIFDWTLGLKAREYLSSDKLMKFDKE
jgi:uncharacterized protein (TIGR04255 family)